MARGCFNSRSSIPVPAIPELAAADPPIGP
jgi:hypothetical protein